MRCEDDSKNAFLRIISSSDKLRLMLFLISCDLEKSSVLDVQTQVLCNIVEKSYL